MISFFFNPIYQFLHLIMSFYFKLNKNSNSSQLGDKWEVVEDVSKETEAFTCIMYGYSKETSVNFVRSKTLKKMVDQDNDL